MAIETIASTTSLSSGFLAQIQKQQAQRNADQAQQQARTLKAQAQSAQAVADRAQENARELRLEAGSAQNNAADARKNLAALDSLGEVQNQLTDLRDQIGSVLKTGALSGITSTDTESPPIASSAVVNAFGQQTGTMVNVTA